VATQAVYLSTLPRWELRWYWHLCWPILFLQAYITSFVFLHCWWMYILFDDELHGIQRLIHQWRERMVFLNWKQLSNDHWDTDRIPCLSSNFGQDEWIVFYVNSKDRGIAYRSLLAESKRITVKIPPTFFPDKVKPRRWPHWKTYQNRLWEMLPCLSRRFDVANPTGQWPWNKHCNCSNS